MTFLPKPTDLAGKKVLLVEDEIAVRAIVSAVLNHFGCEVVQANNGAEALDQFALHAGTFDLLITDLMMPGGMNGADLVQNLHRVKPNLPSMICTGCSFDIPVHLLTAQGTLVLRKPFGPEELLAAMRQILGPTTAKQRNDDPAAEV